MTSQKKKVSATNSAGDEFKHSRGAKVELKFYPEWALCHAIAAKACHQLTGKCAA